MANSPLRYAVIGVGGIAHYHLRDIGRQPDVVTVGLCDSADPAQWRVDAEFANLPKFNDAEKMLRETRPNLVSICTPNKFHHPLALLALKHGAHVACEKPMAMTVADAEEMEAARLAAGRLGGINFSYRNNHAFRHARALIASGKLGRITRVNSVYLQRFLGSPATLHSWRNDVALAGFGTLGDLGVHMIDSVRWITGLDYRRVVGVAATLIPEKLDAAGRALPVTTDTNASFLAELSGGVVATFETTQIAPGFSNFFRVEISGEHGTLAVHSEHPEEFWLCGGDPSACESAWSGGLALQKIPTEVIASGGPPTPGAIVHAIRGRAVEFPSFADGLRAQRVLGAILDSMKTCSWQNLS